MGLSERLPGHIDYVDFLPKVTTVINELSYYRYAVLVHLASTDI